MRILKSPFKRIERLIFSANGEMLIGSGIGTTMTTPEKVMRGIVFWSLDDSIEPQVVLPNSGVTDFQLIPGSEQILVECRDQGIFRLGVEGEANATHWQGTRASMQRALNAEQMEQVEVYYEYRPGPDSLQSLSYTALSETPGLIDRWRQPVEQRGIVVALAFAPGGRSFWTSEQVTIPTQARRRRFVARLVHRETAAGSVLRSFSAPAETVRSIVPSPDGTRLALLTGATVRVGLIDEFETNLGTIHNDTASFFTDLAFDPTSRLLAVASNDSTIKLFETEHWSQLSSFSWGSGKMRSVCFAPDGLTAAAGSSSGQVVIWDVDR
jgi:WD40 repeat protein